LIAYFWWEFFNNLECSHGANCNKYREILFQNYRFLGIFLKNLRLRLHKMIFNRSLPLFSVI